MITIFEEGYFNRYSRVNLDESRDIIAHSQYSSVPTVFISHKHDDLNDLKGLLGFLEQEFHVKVYIDSKDPAMPKITSAKTAENIKQRITKCNKFILLATNAAIESKWCNWELGYGDAKKYDSNSIAIFPMKPEYEGFNGSEYMEIYPHIIYCNGYEKDTNGNFVQKGYYVLKEKDGIEYITPLNQWLYS